MATRSHQKLAFKFFGPYTIAAKVGAIAYKLNLLASSLVHRVFHASQLKRCVSPLSQVSPVLPSTALSHQVPEQVLSTRMSRHGESEVPQLFIKWSHLAPELAT
jgi:hypothetical protein